MTHNDILCHLCSIFDFDNAKIISVFEQANLSVTDAEVVNWLKQDDDPTIVELTDSQFASFLNGFINDQRGKKDGPQPEPEKTLTNNMIFMKLKIALNLQADDVIEILDWVDVEISKYELTALFRKPSHKHYRECRDKLLKNFIRGLQLKYNGEEAVD